MMTRPALIRVPVVPGPDGVAAVAKAIRATLTDSGGPLAIYPDPDAAQAASHSAGFAAAVRADAPADIDDLALVIPTSGSTGEPRGVLFTADAMRAAARLGNEALGGPGIWLTAVPVTGIGGLMTVVRSVVNGWDPVVHPGVAGAAPFTAASFIDSVLELLARARAEGVPAYGSLVPTQLSRLVAAGPTALRLLSRLDALLIGGAALPRRVRAAAEAHGVRLVETYGATETCGGISYDGRPLPGVDIRIATDDTVADTDGLDGLGLVEVGGPTIAAGYRLRPDLTERHFIDGYFRTPDLGRLLDGRLVVEGRRDQVIKVGGHKVSLLAVTQALRSHPRVIDAVTVASPEDEWGAVPVSAVVPDDTAVTSTDFDRDALRAELIERVAATLGRASAPRRIEIVSDLPSLHTGKTDSDWFRSDSRGG